MSPTTCMIMVVCNSWRSVKSIGLEDVSVPHRIDRFVGLIIHCVPIIVIRCSPHFMVQLKTILIKKSIQIFPALSFYGYLSIILGLVLVIMIIVSFLGYRHYKFEAEINRMSWRIVYTDVLRCNPHGNHNHRGSVHSLAKRGSQIVSWIQYLLPFISLHFYSYHAFARRCTQMIWALYPVTDNYSSPLDSTRGVRLPSNPLM